MENLIEKEPEFELGDSVWLRLDPIREKRKKTKKCPACGGSGNLKGLDGSDCWCIRCHGEGKVPNHQMAKVIAYETDRFIVSAIKITEVKHINGESSVEFDYAISRNSNGEGGFYTGHTLYGTEEEAKTVDEPIEK